MIGVNKGDVTLVPHSKKWGKLFDKEKNLLYSLIGKHTIEIQHIGSTAISGIYAKPIIDIMIGVQSIADIEMFDQNLLKTHGYFHLQRVRMNGKVVFAKFMDLENLTKTHILHIVEYNGDWWNKHISFRNYLRENSEAAREYEELKLSLALKYPHDERTYTDKKKRFVDEILSKQ
ncbi:GrpB family protein [Bacillus spongiae]|uniref:GrpB family protein n=1 Tax=Bacillus spongiae TaxID=2683610 RepID=A0ABU8HHW2_9BACI